MGDKRIEKTKALIKKTFLELAETSDVERITVKAICDRANINRGTFYYHYLDVPDLIEKLETAAAERITQSILARYHFDRKTSDLLEDLFLCLKKYPEDALLLFGKKGGHHEKGLEHLYNALKKTALPQWKAKSHVTEEQSEIIFNHTMHSIFNLLRLWESGEVHMCEKEFRKLYNNIITYGIYSYIYK
nr:TetR/AcrR family transcriptional regulator [uncultured Schaedlerella sp.]